MASNANDAENTLQPMDHPDSAPTTTDTPHATQPSLSNEILQHTIATSNALAAASPAGSDAPLSAEGRALSLKVSLADLAARASHHYAQKHFEDAAEIYSQAADMQAEMNGEMSPDNAEILFLYGRSLFKVGQAKSDVLGGRAPQTENGGGDKARGKKKGSAGKKKKAVTAEGGEGQDAAAGEKVATAVAGRAVEEGKKEGQKELEAKGQLFQFTGDENWDDTDDEEGDDAEEGDEDEEEDDDLATAFEVLDLARVLMKMKLDEKLAAADASEGKGKEVVNGQGDDAEIRHIKERLADTHDLLMEISLENERYVYSSVGFLPKEDLLINPTADILTRSPTPENPSSTSKNSSRKTTRTSPRPTTSSRSRSSSPPSRSRTRRPATPQPAQPPRRSTRSCGTRLSRSSLRPSTAPR